MIKESLNQTIQENQKLTVIDRMKKDYIDLNNPEDREIIIKVLKNQNYRSKQELQFLRRAFQHLNFFQEKSQQFSEQAQLNIYQSLNFKHVPKRNILFHFGDDGDTYYIILRGSISVMIPRSSLRSQIKKGKVSIEFMQDSFELGKMIFQKNYISESHKDTLPSKQEPSQSRSVSMRFNMNLQLQIDTEKTKEKEYDEARLRLTRGLSLKTSQQQKFIPLVQKQRENLWQHIASQSIKEFSNAQQSQIKVNTVKRECPLQNNFEREIQEFQDQVFPQYDCMKILKTGEAFGETALVSNERRTATIFVREDTDFATINRYQFQQILKEIEDIIRYSKIKEIKNLKVDKIFIQCFLLYQGLDLLSFDDLEDAIKVIKIRKYHIHEIIYREQSESDEIYFIKEGSVELSTSYKDNRISYNIYKYQLILEYNLQISQLINNTQLQSKIPLTHDGRVRVATILQQEVFGWEEILCKKQRNYMAQALESTETYILPKQVKLLSKYQNKQFLKYFEENQAFKKYFLDKDILIQKYRHELLDQSVKQKSNLEVSSDRALALTFRNLHKKQQSDPNLKIYTQDFNEKFKEVSHIQQMTNNNHIVQHRLKNFSQIIEKDKQQKSLLENPMFLVPQKQLLEKKHQEIRRQFSVMRGEGDRFQLMPNYIYTNANITKDLSTSTISKMSRFDIKFQSMLELKKGRTKLPSIEDQNTQRDDDFSLKLVALVSPKSINPTPKTNKWNSVHVQTLKGKSQLFSQTTTLTMI